MNQMGFSLTFSIVIIVAALLVGGSLYLYMVMNVSPVNSVDTTKITRSDWIKYRNEELGFQFSYPEK